MLPPCYYHATTMLLPCYYHATTMLPPCYYHATTMLLPRTTASRPPPEVLHLFLPFSRFRQRITDTAKLSRERAAAARAAAGARAARAAAAATDAEDAQAAAAQVEMVPAGARRACFHAGMSYVRDKASTRIVRVARREALGGQSARSLSYYLLLLTHPPPLTTHHSPSPLTTHPSPLTTHHSPLTTHHSPL